MLLVAICYKCLHPCPDVREFEKHGLEADKNCGRVAAGIGSGGLPGRCDVRPCAGGKTMLLPWRTLLQDGVLRRAQNAFRSSCARSRPNLFAKWAAGAVNTSHFRPDAAFAACERTAFAFFFGCSDDSHPAFPARLLLSPLSFRRFLP
jgi:hypothetical protein